MSVSTWYEVVKVYCKCFFIFLVGVCVLQMQNAVVPQLSSPPAALCAVTVVYQERKEQSASVV